MHHGQGRILGNRLQDQNDSGKGIIEFSGDTMMISAD
jgi:hypothetical protein